MYCGDETGAFVGDVGRDTCRFGYGGEDVPKTVTSSYAPTTCSLLHPRKEDVKAIYDVNDYEKDGVQDWEAWQSVWEYGLTTMRVMDGHKHRSDESTQHPLLAVGKCEETMLEIMLEGWQAPACFVAPTAMCTSFGFGRQTSLVVDVGHGGTRVTPIVDGIPLYHSQRSSGRGGAWINDVQQHILEHHFFPQPTTVSPRYQHSPRYKPTTTSTDTNDTPVFHKFAMHQLMYEVKTNPHVSMSPTTDATIPFFTCGMSNTTNHQSNHDDDDDDDPTPEQYQLPDGTIIDYQATDMGADLKRLPDLFFAATVPDICTTSNAGVDLVELIRQTLTQVHVDVRKELAGNIILAGGSSLFPEFPTRLSAELTEQLPSMYKYRVLSSRNTMERRYAPWIGASVLTSLGSFQQLWLSKAEYDEYGPGIATKRFP